MNKKTSTSTIKVVLNKCYGGFGLSKAAYEFLGLTTWNEDHGFHFSDRSKLELRTDPELVRCVETLGAKANGIFSNLKVVKIPADVKFTIEEYGGFETAEEIHRSW